MSSINSFVLKLLSKYLSTVLIIIVLAEMLCRGSTNWPTSVSNSFIFGENNLSKPSATWTLNKLVLSLVVMGINLVHLMSELLRTLRILMRLLSVVSQQISALNILQVRETVYRARREIGLWRKDTLPAAGEIGALDVDGAAAG